MIAVTGDYPFQFAIILADNKGPEFIDIDRLALKTILQGPDLDPAFEGRGETFPFPDNGLVFAAFDQEVVVLKFLQDAGEKEALSTSWPTSALMEVMSFCIAVVKWLIGTFTSMPMPNRQ